MLDAITNDSYVRTIFADIHLQHATAKQGDMKKESPIVGNVGESLQLYEVPFLESLEELMEQQGEEPWIDGMEFPPIEYLEINNINIWAKFVTYYLQRRYVSLLKC